jgi:putative addiction module killer protein
VQAKRESLPALTALKMEILVIARPLVRGVSEMRIHFGPGYRVYWKRMDGEIVILLAGGDKSTQQSDIAQALQLAQLLKEK